MRLGTREEVFDLLQRGHPLRAHHADFALGGDGPQAGAGLAEPSSWRQRQLVGTAHRREDDECGVITRVVVPEFGAGDTAAALPAR
ncbi:MAG: hypothetical protein ACLUKH_21700 [Flavonifractor plautii]